MPLKWEPKHHCYDEADPTYVSHRSWVVKAGKVRIATVAIWYGDSNNANSLKGTVVHARVTGRFKQTWTSRGYTWKKDHPYVPACESDQVPIKWVEQKWSEFLKNAGLQEIP